MEKAKKAKKEKPKKKKKAVEVRVKKDKTSPVAVSPVKHDAAKGKYFEGVGRRKTAVARVRIFPNKGKGSSVTAKSALHSSPSSSQTETDLINGKLLKEYFPLPELQQTVKAPLDLTDYSEQFNFSVKLNGGGLFSQAEAVRHGIARALVLFSPELRKKLKKAGYLKRDPRMRERKKFGLKRARRAPQWKKR